MSARVKELAELRRRTEALQAMRSLRRPAPGAAARARAPTAGVGRALRPVRHAAAEDHRHLLHTVDGAILCTCEPCWAMRAGDRRAAADGHARSLWLNGFQLPGELWAAFQIPVGLAFLMRSSADAVGRRVLPVAGGGDRVRARPGRLGAARRSSTRCSSRSRPTARR